MLQEEQTRWDTQRECSSATPVVIALPAINFRVPGFENTATSLHASNRVHVLKCHGMLRHPQYKTNTLETTQSFLHLKTG